MPDAEEMKKNTRRFRAMDASISAGELRKQVAGGYNPAERQRDRLCTGDAFRVSVRPSEPRGRILRGITVDFHNHIDEIHNRVLVDALARIQASFHLTVKGECRGRHFN